MANILKDLRELAEHHQSYSDSVLDYRAPDRNHRCLRYDWRLIIHSMER